MWQGQELCMSPSSNFSPHIVCYGETMDVGHSSSVRMAIWNHTWTNKRKLTKLQFSLYFHQNSIIILGWKHQFSEVPFLHIRGTTILLSMCYVMHFLPNKLVQIIVLTLLSKKDLFLGFFLVTTTPYLYVLSQEISAQEINDDRRNLIAYCLGLKKKRIMRFKPKSTPSTYGTACESLNQRNVASI